METSNTKELYPMLCNSSSLKKEFGFGKYCVMLIVPVVLLLVLISLLSNFSLNFDVMAVCYEFMAGLNGLPSTSVGGIADSTMVLFFSSLALVSLAYGLFVLPSMGKS